MPRTYSPGAPKTRARAAADPVKSEAALSRAQRRRMRASARPQRSTRQPRTAGRPRPRPGGKAKDVDPRVPLVKGTRLTGAGRKAAARGQEEYQELVDRFEGRVHLSRGRPAAANARLKLGSRPSHVPAPRGRSSSSVPQSTSSNPSVPGPQSSPSVPRSTSSSHRRATVPPPPRDDEFAFLSESEDSRAADEADGHGPGGQPDVTVRVEAKAPVIAVQVPRVRSAKEACGPGRKGTSGRSDKAPGDAGGPVGRPAPPAPLYA